MTTQPKRRWARLYACIVYAFFIVHMLGAIGWWQITPGGFSLSTIHGWSNGVIPWLLIVINLMGVVLLARGRTHAARHPIVCMAALWAGAAATAYMLFPHSARRLLPLLLAPSVLTCGVLLPGWIRREPAGKSRTGLPAVLIGTVVGVTMVFSMRGATPSVIPANSPIQIWPAGSKDHAAKPISEHVRIAPHSAQLDLRTGRMALTVYPMLTIRSRSPDRCWTNFASPSGRAGTPRLLQDYTHLGDEARLRFLGDGHEVLAVRSEPERVEIDARTELPEDVYSHLNTYCRVYARTQNAAQAIYLAFSPCAEERIEVKVSDYPVGRPARFAYLGADGIFRVVEATTGEKGPFRELASGPLVRGNPLTITLYDGNEAASRITLRDWTAQASTAYSPTAGWGVPQNAIEFSRTQDGGIAIYVTLAATSVGRGWDSVGHAAGVYQNRMTIEHLASAYP